MALGPFAFRGLGLAFDQQGMSQETPWASVEVADRFDALQWTGPKSKMLSIRGVLFDVEFGGQESFDGIAAAAAAGQPLMLVTMAGRVHGLHVVLNISEDRTHIMANGQARMNHYSIDLQRYHGAGGLLGGVAGGIAGAISGFF